MQSSQKLVWLRYAVAKAASASQTLSVWLAAQVVTAGDKLVSGKDVVNASAGGTGTGYQIGSRSGRTPDAILEFWDELLTLYTASRAALVAAGDASPTEDEVVAEMRFRLSPAESAVAGFDSEWVGVPALA